MNALGRTSRRWRAAALALLVVSLVAPRARADVEGVIVALDAGEMVIDLGATRGAREGDVVELWRPLQLRHPLTGRPLVERFRTGALRLTQVRPAMALATVEGTPSRAPASGDIVVLRRAAGATGATEAPPPAGASGREPAPAGSAATPASAAPASAVPAAGAAPVDPEADELARMLGELTGAAPAARAVRYRAFVRRWPVGRAARGLAEEAAMLEALEGRGGGAGRPPEPRVSFAPPRAAMAGRPVRLAIELPADSRGAVLHVRSAGEATYRSLPMDASGPGYFGLTLAGEQVQGPELLYFIEGVDPAGRAQPGAGEAGRPLRLPVVDPTSPRTLGRGPITASLWVDYASYNRLRSDDYMVQTEGFFGVRLADEGVRAVRSGFGVLRGVGGTLDELDVQRLPGRKVGLTYGYLEGEWAPNPTYALLARGVIGLRRDGTGTGGQLFVRLGNDLRTNLLVGGEFLGGVGLRGITQLDWRTIPRVPIVLRTEVTNQPAGEEPSDPPLDASGSPTEARGKSEVGLRAIVQVGYELTPALTIAGRASYQGRTINHAGPGLGAAVSYQW